MRDGVLKRGDKVVIALIPGDYAVTPGLMMYNGNEAIVSKVLRPKKHFASNGSRAPYGYELENVVSEFGVPYTFTRDMLFTY